MGECRSLEELVEQATTTDLVYGQNINAGSIANPLLLSTIETAANGRSSVVWLKCPSEEGGANLSCHANTYLRLTQDELGWEKESSEARLAVIEKWCTESRPGGVAALAQQWTRGVLGDVTDPDWPMFRGSPEHTGLDTAVTLLSVVMKFDHNGRVVQVFQGNPATTPPILEDREGD